MTDPRVQPYVVQRQQNWSLLNERRYQEEALYRYGEYAMFVMMWNLDDFKAGLVGRCQRCYVSYGAVANAYKQSSLGNCPDCFGTTYEGGYRARVVRPAIWSDSADDMAVGPRGEVQTTNTTVQTTGDIRLRATDYVFRADGSRWEIQRPTVLPIRTGFGQNHDELIMANLPMQAIKLDETDTVFLIPPSPSVIVPALNQPVTVAPLNFSAVEDIRGPLLGV